MSYEDYKNQSLKNNDSNESKYCAITEQGDLGLGASVLCEQDQEIMRNNQEQK